MREVTIDADDLSEDNHRLDLFAKLKELNPKFKCTAFAIPNKGSAEFWESIPKWIELAVHGWDHPTPVEAIDWSYMEMDFYMSKVHPRFVKGFKAPGWQISDPTYQWLLDNGWWVCDQSYNNERRPKGLKYYLLDDITSHHHIQNVCQNGLEESWDKLLELVTSGHNFKFISEVVAL